MNRYLGYVLVVACLSLLGGHRASAEGMGSASSYAIAPGFQLQMTVDGQAWQVAKTAPQFLVDDGVADIEHDLKTAGKTATKEQIMARVAEQLGSNELYVFNPDSKAVLEISFSPLDKGESPPSSKSIKESAVDAGESMTSEGGVTGSQYRIKEDHIPGADTVYRLDVDYQADGSPRKFIGLIGFAQTSWIFFYYTDRLANPGDYAEMEKTLKSLVIQPVANPMGDGK